MRGLFVTGTDTGVGKTVLSAALLAALAAEGERVRAHKPVLTGLDERSPGPLAARTRSPTRPYMPSARRICPDSRPAGRAKRWPPDHELLAGVAGMTPEAVAPLRYGPAVSPHLAAELAGERIDPVQLLASAAPANREAAAAGGAHAPVSAGARGRRAGEAGAGSRGSTLIVEGVGGLLTPLAEDYTVRDFAAALKLPVLIAARPGLGTINHTLLTLEAAREGGLDVRAVVLTPWPAEPSRMQRSNRKTIIGMTGVEVAVLARVTRPAPALLARAGAGLPYARWLGEPSAAMRGMGASAS